MLKTLLQPRSFKRVPSKTFYCIDRWVMNQLRGGGRGTIFKLLGILPKITDGTNGERCILFRGVWLTFNNNKKKEKKGVFSLRACGGGRRTIFKLLGILPKITYGKNGERCILFSRFSCTFEKKERKKSGLFTKARSVGRGTIFKLLGILLKITDGTNGERCILFRGVWLTFNNNNNNKKKGEFSIRREVVVEGQFSNF